METHRSSTSVELCFLGAVVPGGSASACLSPWGFFSMYVHWRLACLWEGCGVSWLEPKLDSLIRVICKYLQCLRHFLLTSDAGDNQKNQWTQADLMLCSDKYLDSQFGEAGYGAVGKWLWPLGPQEEIINFTPFLNIQNAFRGEWNIPFGEWLTSAPFLILALGSLLFEWGGGFVAQSVFLVQLLSPPDMGELVDGTLSFRLLKIYCKCSWLFPLCSRYMWRLLEEPTLWMSVQPAVWGESSAGYHGRRLSLFSLLEQNTTDWGTWGQQKCISLRPGGWKPEIRASVVDEVLSGFADFLPCPHEAEGTEGSPWSLSYKPLIPFMRFYPPDLRTSQRSHILIPSPSGVKIPAYDF